MFSVARWLWMKTTVQIPRGSLIRVRRSSYSATSRHAAALLNIVEAKLANVAVLRWTCENRPKPKRSPRR